MAFARLKADGNSESLHQRFTELSDEIRAKNKREDRRLDLQLKFFERQKNISLNLIHKEQHQVERTRMSICEEANKIQAEKQNQLAVPAWMTPRSQSITTILQFPYTDFDAGEWELSSSEIQSEIGPSTSADTTTATKVDTTIAAKVDTTIAAKVDTTIAANVDTTIAAKVDTTIAAKVDTTIATKFDIKIVTLDIIRPHSAR